MTSRVSDEDVRLVARLARFPVEYAEDAREKLESTLDFIDKLRDVDVEGVEPWTPTMLSPTISMRRRADVVADGGDVETVLKNAPAREEDFYVVPRVVD